MFDHVMVTDAMDDSLLPIRQVLPVELPEVEPIGEHQLVVCYLDFCVGALWEGSYEHS